MLLVLQVVYDRTLVRALSLGLRFRVKVCYPALPRPPQILEGRYVVTQ